MMKEHWVAAAFTSDALVAELLLRLKQSSSPDSSHTATASLNPLGWGNRKSRSRPSPAAATVTGGFRKEQQQRSPSTPLSWSGGASASTSDAYDESSRPSDLPAGGRSAKADYYRNPEKKADQFIEISSCKIESESESLERQFVLPDLNMTPNDDELAVP